MYNIEVGQNCNVLNTEKQKLHLQSLYKYTYVINAWYETKHFKIDNLILNIRQIDEKWEKNCFQNQTHYRKMKKNRISNNQQR
jgi:hypothetical protein